MLADGNRLIEEYIGVTFHNGPTIPAVGTEMTVILTLLNYPKPAHYKLLPGVTFTIREGSEIVGYGAVCRWMD